MQRTDSEPDDGPGATGSPRQSDRPPVGEPLVVSRRARPGVPVPSGPPEPTGPLAGQVGLVTGATSELGTAFVDALVDRGARVLLVDHDLDGLRAVAARLPGDDRAVVVRCDLGSDDDVLAACDFVRRAGASVDLVVHAATPDAPDGPDDPLAAMDRQYSIGVRAPSLLTTHLAAAMGSTSGVLLVEREPGDEQPAPRSSVFAAVRRGLVELLRGTLAADGVRLLTASCTAAGDVAEFASVVLDAACRPGDARVTALSVDGVPEASEPIP